MKNYTICITDDDEDDFFILKDTFDSLGLPYELLYLKDGEELIDYLIQKPIRKMLPALILLDYNMPKKNGLETLTEIRAHSHLATVPIIIYSTSDCTSLHRMMMDNGANGFITKNTSMNKIVEFVKNLDAYLKGKAEIPGKNYKSVARRFSIY